MDVLNLQKH